MQRMRMTSMSIAEVRRRKVAVIWSTTAGKGGPGTGVSICLGASVRRESAHWGAKNSGGLRVSGEQRYVGARGR